MTSRNTEWLALSAIALALVACGGSEADPTGEPAGPQAESRPQGPLSRVEVFRGDYPEMVERRVIRALTTFNRTQYFLDGGTPRGATYEALREFEKFVNEREGRGRLQIELLILPVARDQLLPALLEGRGDLAAANLTIIPERLATVDFSIPIVDGVHEVVVTGPAAPALERLEDLSGQEIAVRRSSSYSASLERLNDRLREQGLPPVRIREVDELLETEDVLEMVNAGIYPMTVADSTLADFWEDLLQEIVVRRDLTLRSGGAIGWAFRRESPELEAVVNEFLRPRRQGTLLGNILLKRYLKRNTWARDPLASEDRRRFERHLPTFQKYGERYDVDWLLLMAQAYQESKLDQSVKSRAGAVGIMQIKPTTAADPNVGIADISTAEANIHAGTKYHRFLRDRYFAGDEIAPLDQGLLALAAYNAGPGRMRQLRRQAAEQGLDPDVWFRHVEQLAPRETVGYVSNIFKYYVAYREHLRRAGALAATPTD